MELLGKLAGEVDLRLCLRAVTEGERDRMLAAGVDVSQIRRQSNCHAKLIIVDDNMVIVGSQNFSNLGFVANRDASLAFENTKITEYFASIFEADWDRASPIADGDSFGIRVATDETTPPGFYRAPWSVVFDEPPPPVTPVSTLPKPPVATVAPAAVSIPFFGIDENGKRAEENVAKLAKALRDGPALVDDTRRRLGDMMVTPSFGIPVGAAAESLADVGWGVVWAPGTPQAVKDALRPLVEHRAKEVNDELMFHELDYKAGESFEAFIQSRGGALGAIKPESIPYYLLLVGNPQQIPFSFQSLLDVEYRVGRLDFGADADAYERYAKSVVAVETGKTAKRDRLLHAFGPKHDGDAPTTLSVEVLVRAAASWLAASQKLVTKHGLRAESDAGDAATKKRLLELLKGAQGRPEVLLTAGHGLVVPAGSAMQPADQGALVTAEWDGFSGPDEECCFAAADLAADADVAGLVAFLFACFGLGTPATDSFPTRAGQVLANQPFTSALPRALLSHPQGGALGVFGHVDRTLVWSLQPPQAGVATDPFARAVLNVLVGNRLGAALEDLNQRGATLSSILSQALKPGAPPVANADLVRTWTQQRDACAFMLLGDPAARLPRA
jgi:hypothetical protein